jgi:Concanavalin A-like lectin/glucanases superfamily/Secretion system C-terminal sorting domain
MSNQMTISTWFKMTGDGSEPSQGGILVNKEGEYEIAVFNDNTIRWAIGVSGATGWDWTNTNITINRNEWYHMTFIYNGGIIKLFLNGNLVYTQNTNITVIGDVDINLNDLRIGGRSCCGGQYFNGKIDEVRLYNRALSQTEVSQLYQTENSRLVCTNPVGQPTHTASFNYQIGTGTASMRFGDGQTAALTGTSGTITHAYNKTGIYYAELLKDNIPVDTFAVTVKTCGWISKVGTYWCNPFFNDVQTCTAVTGNGIFHIPVNPGAAVCGEYASYTERFQDFGVSGDNCSYEIRAKDPVSEGGCPIWKDVNLIICGKKSTAGVSILDGNTYWPTIWAGRTSSARSAHPEFSQDLEQWHTFKIQTENHTIKAFYDGVLLTTLPYDGEVGDVIGIRVVFKGTGSIDWAEVRANGAANAAFREDFTTCDEATATRQSRTIQYGDSLVFNGHTYRTTGTYRDTLSCDNMVITNLTVLSCVAQITSDVPNNQLTCLYPNATLTPSVTTGGVAPYTVRWENGSTIAQRTVHHSGSYAVTITDANGCISSSSIAITNEAGRPEVTVTPNVTPELTCRNTAVAVMVNLSGAGQDGFSYLIKRNGSNYYNGTLTFPYNHTFNLAAIQGGTYAVEITNLNTGCTMTEQVSIRESRNRLDTNQFRILAPTTQLNCNTTAIPLTVVGANGNPLTGYHYAWTQTDLIGNVSNSRTILTAGMDSVWVINDTSGCRSLLPQTIGIQQNIVPPTVSITASNLHFTCGINSIALTATGGATYLWNDNTTANPKSIQNTGTFTVTGTGANGCQNTANVTIGQTAGVIRLPQVQQTICQGDSLDLGNQRFVKTAGDYTIWKTGRFSCDTTYTLRLSVEDSTLRQAISIAAGTSYTIGSSTYSVSGTYVNRVASTNGCMRTVTTVLTVLPVGTSLDTAYRIPNVVIPCQGSDFCIDITKNNITYDTRGWQGTVFYPTHCVKYVSSTKGNAIQAAFTDFVVDTVLGKVNFAIASAVGANIASVGSIVQMCFKLKNNAGCNAPYLISASPVLESFTDNARNHFVNVGSSRVTTTTNDTVQVSLKYCGTALQPFGNVVGTGNAYTEIKSCNPNQTGVMLPDPQGNVVCKAGDHIQATRYPNANPLNRMSVVNSMDAYRIIQFANRNPLAGIPDGMHWRAADVDGSGQVLANDAYAALRISVGLDAVKFIWLPTTQVDTIGMARNNVPFVNDCISMPSPACTPQQMEIQTIQRGDFWAQSVPNDGRLAPLRQEIYMDLTRTYRIGDTIVIPIGYESATTLNAVDLDLTTTNNRLRFAQVEAKPNSGFDQFLSNPSNNLVRNSGFGTNIGGMCFLQLKVIVPNGITLQASDFTATRSLLNGVDASFGFRATTTTCVTGIPDPIVEAKIGLFPNPTSQQLTIDYNQAVKQLSIVNLLGQSLKTLEINASGRMDVDVSELPSGVYFLKINEKEMKKFVKL